MKLKPCHNPVQENSENHKINITIFKNNIQKELILLFQKFNRDIGVTGKKPTHEYITLYTKRHCEKLIFLEGSNIKTFSSHLISTTEGLSKYYLQKITFPNKSAQ